VSNLGVQVPGELVLHRAAGLRGEPIVDSARSGPNVGVRPK